VRASPAGDIPDVSTEDVMQVGMQLLFQNYLGRQTDEEMWRDQMHLADLAEPLGFDSLWTVEHHFSDYSICPNALSFLCWAAGRTSTIKLGTAAVILPWHNPLRVAVEAAMVDQFSGGRLLLGFGRGLARREYEAWQIDMNTTRTWFDESARMISRALETGIAEYDGEVIKQVPAEIRPRPSKSFKGRLYSVAMSPDSVPIAAEIGATMMMFSQVPWEQKLDDINTWRRLYREQQGATPPPVLTLDFVYCDADKARAEEKSRDYATKYYHSVIQHYEMDKKHFKDTKGYQSYDNAARVIQDMGLEAVAQEFAGIQASGTPDQILRKLERRREMIGDFQFRAITQYSGMPVEEAERSMRLFAKEVMPVLKSWTSAETAAAAE
jgi:alkanesulfonate monooxygenase SsuD/methylene tetrahydromethanopterin reductase-like flavin-dependent oxidoreductase (luciferase family)